MEYAVFSKRYNTPFNFLANCLEGKRPFAEITGPNEATFNRFVEGETEVCPMLTKKFAVYRTDIIMEQSVIVMVSPHPDMESAMRTMMNTRQDDPHSFIQEIWV